MGDGPLNAGGRSHQSRASFPQGEVPAPRGWSCARGALWGGSTQPVLTWSCYCRRGPHILLEELGAPVGPLHPQNPPLKRTVHPPAAQPKSAPRSCWQCPRLGDGVMMLSPPDPSWDPFSMGLSGGKGSYNAASSARLCLFEQGWTSPGPCQPVLTTVPKSLLLSPHPFLSFGCLHVAVLHLLYRDGALQPPPCPSGCDVCLLLVIRDLLQSP